MSISYVPIDKKVRVVARIILDRAGVHSERGLELKIEREVFFNGIPGLTEQEWKMAMEELKEKKMLRDYEWDYRGLPPHLCVEDQVEDSRDYYPGDIVDGRLPGLENAIEHQFDILGVIIHDPNISLLAQFLRKGKAASSKGDHQPSKDLDDKEIAEHIWVRHKGGKGGCGIINLCSDKWVLEPISPKASKVLLLVWGKKSYPDKRAFSLRDIGNSIPKKGEQAMKSNQVSALLKEIREAGENIATQLICKEGEKWTWNRKLSPPIK